MEDATAGAKRWGWDAALLAIAAPGLGYLYVGRPRAAIVVALALVIGFPTLLAAVVLLDVDVLVGTGSVVVVALAVQAVVVVHCAVSARRRGADFRLRRYNHVGIYLAWFVVEACVFMAASELREAFVVDTFKNPTDSMSPTLESGDHFIVTKQARDLEARRGDVIVFRYPEDPRVLFAKRVLGVAGEELRFFADRVEIDGRALTRTPCTAQPDAEFRCFMETDADGNTYAIRELVAGPASDGAQRFVVPPGHIFVVGDTRQRSHDSREWGSLRLDAVIGRAHAIWWPFGHAGALDRPR